MLLSLQLFSARNDEPYEKVIAGLGKLGYDAVEGFFGVFDEAPAVRKALDTAGMTMSSVHIPLEMCENNPDQVLQLAKTFGFHTIYAPWLAPEERPTDKAGWLALAARLAKLGKFFKSHGLNFGWHNHDFEFIKLPDGSTGMEILLQEAPDIDWEADIAWIVRGGADPFDWIDKYGQRITAVHFKDLAPKDEKLDEDGWADAGTGILDWPGLYAKLAEKSRASLVVAEHDNPNDFGRFARNAAENYRRLGQ